MDTFQIIIGIFAAIVAGLIVNYLWDLYKKPSRRKGYLLYDLRSYEVAENGQIEVILLWNPTQYPIKKADISQIFICNNDISFIQSNRSTNHKEPVANLISQKIQHQKIWFGSFRNFLFNFFAVFADFSCDLISSFVGFWCFLVV